MLVLTEEGEPLPGVLVRAVPAGEVAPDPDRSGRVPVDRPLEELAAEIVERTRREREGRVEAVTGEDGACDLVGLRDRPYSVDAYLEGWSFRSVTPNERVRPGAEVRFRAADRACLPLTVLRPGGDEPASADVTVSGRIGTGHRRWTPGRREAWLPPDVWTVTATAGEDDELRSAPVDVSLPPAGLREPVVLRLEPRTGIRGRVVLPEGELAAAGGIRALRLLDDEAAETERLLDAEQSREVKARPDGTFALLDLEPGRWLVGLVTKEGAVGRTVVGVSRGLADCEIVLPPPDPDASAIVTVLGPDGRLDGRVSVVSELTVDDRRRSGPPGVPLRDGGFRVTHARPADGEAAGGGSYTIVVRSRLHGEARVPYGGPGVRRVEVQLEKPASLTVVVRGYAESAHVGHVKLILVPAEGAGGGPFWSTDRAPDDQGRYRLPVITPGDYRLVVQAMPDKTTRIPALVEPLTVLEGDNRLEIALPPLHTLTILSDAPGSRFGLRPPLDSRQRWRIAARAPQGGRVVWEHLPAGEYRIDPQGPSRRGIDVTLPGRSEVRYDPRPDNCILVRITDPAGVLGAAGLRDGDLIVAIDGTALTDSRQMQALAVLALKKKEATLTVERGGRRFEVTADLSDTGSWGGRLEHARR